MLAIEPWRRTMIPEVSALLNKRPDVRKRMRFARTPHGGKVRPSVCRDCKEVQLEASFKGNWWEDGKWCGSRVSCLRTITDKPNGVISAMRPYSRDREVSR